jgi:hypothetical protein
LEKQEDQACEKMSCGEAKEELLHFHEVWRIKHGPRNEGLVHGGAGSQLAMGGIDDNTAAPTVARTLATEEPSTMEEPQTTPATDKPSSI